MDVALDGADLQLQEVADLLVGEALGDEPQDLNLLRGEPGAGRRGLRPLGHLGAEAFQQGPEALG